MTQNELNFLAEALHHKNEELLKDIVDSDTFKKNALAKQEEKKSNETKKGDKE